MPNRENLEDTNYRRFRKRLIDEVSNESDEAIDYYSQVYEKCGELFSDSYEAIFPIGIDITQVSSQIVWIEVRGWGKIQTTIGELLRKVIVAGEEKMDELWQEERNAIRSRPQKTSQLHSEGSV